MRKTFRGYTTLIELSTVAALSMVLLPVIAITTGKTIQTVRIERARAAGAIEALRLFQSLESDALSAEATRIDGPGRITFMLPGAIPVEYRTESGRLIRVDGKTVRVLALNAVLFECIATGDRMVRVKFTPSGRFGTEDPGYRTSVVLGGAR